MKKILLCLSASIIVTFSVYSFGPHTGLDCVGCHDPHYAKGMKIFKVKNEKLINPRTGKPIDGISQLCLGCHNIEAFDGSNIRPIHLNMTHPVNIEPNGKIAQVPEILKRDGVLQCISCHDPHPSNSNWKYLRVDTAGGTTVGKFCQMCHPAKADSSFYDMAKSNLQIFSSMDESKGSGVFALADNPVCSNPTPIYIKALGKFPNKLAPAFTHVPQQDWIFDPKPEDVAPELRKYLEEEKATETPANDSTKTNESQAPVNTK